MMKIVSVAVCDLGHASATNASLARTMQIKLKAQAHAEGIASKEHIANHMRRALCAAKTSGVVPNRRSASLLSIIMAARLSSLKDTKVRRGSASCKG